MHISPFLLLPPEEHCGADLCRKPISLRIPYDGQTSKENRFRAKAIRHPRMSRGKERQGEREAKGTLPALRGSARSLNEIETRRMR